MPEGDTVYLAAQRLHNALGGTLLTRGELRVPWLAAVDLEGRRVLEVISRGKHLLMRFDDGMSLHTHLKMEGAWHLYRHGRRWRGPTHQARVILENDHHIAVGFRLGIVELLPTSEERDAVGHLGPDPLGADWDEEEAVRRILARPEEAIGDVLLDQTVIAGAGNVYRCEICFLRGVHPDTPVVEVLDIPGLVRLLARALRANRDTGRQITTGDTRSGKSHWVYGRAGQPCRRCGRPVQRKEGEAERRVTYWCHNCQRPRVSGGDAVSLGETQEGLQNFPEGSFHMLP